MTSTQMFLEAASAPAVVAHQLAEAGATIEELSARLQAKRPSFVVTCARGSSDHAATFAKYLIESRLGLATASAAPSIASQYAVPLELSGSLFLAISQSGASPDLLRTTEAAKQGGALVVALVNTVESPLAALADVVIPLSAGSEVSVAATKSFIATLSALAQLVATWTEDRALSANIAALPPQLEQAWELDWSLLVDRLVMADNLFVIGRGIGLGIAQEAALKLKETCGLHAEAFSAAEVKHGPMALIRANFPVLLFSQDDQTQQSVEDVADMVRERGARVMLAGSRAGSAWRLPSISNAEPVLEPILQIQSFYKAANALSLARGFDPDVPPLLRKVTETL